MVSDTVRQVSANFPCISLTTVTGRAGQHTPETALAGDAVPDPKRDLSQTAFKKTSLIVTVER